jgi:hypothetical protein
MKKSNLAVIYSFFIQLNLFSKIEIKIQIKIKIKIKITFDLLYL